ncbi:factor-independent urate hydroxylase [Neorhizobium sp. NCHU2750]|uniref:factor-independent urate hydroxylase n=1 Tax=Neorhizobium sp. NCHU2750 TaxID=1825976 RepID=UPI000E725C35|nr:urate oxidase [Neorhizobium sp. NCHU2750]
MALISNTYGKGRVRVMRIKKDGPLQDVREMNVKAMLTGAFSPAFTSKDNSPVVSTDTIKNVVNIVARENLGLDKEEFCAAVAQRFLDKYPQVETATVIGHETKWLRKSFDGVPHPHTFTLDGNGRPFAKVVATREGQTLYSGLSGYTFMKSTQSGWDNYFMDPYTTIKETRDRIAATSMEAHWLWDGKPADYETANATVLETMLKVFGTTYSESMQDSLYRMAMAALDAVPDIREISLACPNKHYLLINLDPFGLTNDNDVFVPTDEPHGQIECVVGRD